MVEGFLCEEFDMKKVIVFLMALTVIGGANAGNMLANGDFEDSAKSGWTLWWGDDTENANRYLTDPVEGDNCAAVWWHDVGILQEIPIGPGMYEFGGKIMTTEGMFNRRGLIQAEIGGLELQLDIVPGDATNEWFVKSGIIDNTTLGATTIVINLLMDSYDINPFGVVFYDDIYLGPLGISKEAKFPIPSDGDTAVPRSTDVLSWQNPDPNSPGDTITCDVYLVESDSNNLAPSSAVATGITSGSVTLSTLIPPIFLSPLTQYYWRVDSTDPHGDPVTEGPVTTQGGEWTFTVIDDEPPVADAGPDQYLWLDMADGDGDPCKVTFTLTGNVTDDAQSTLTTLWSLTYSEQAPATVVTITNDAAPITTVTIDGTGLYTFQLDADDAYSHDDDTVTVIVYGSACEAAKGDPDDIPTTYPNGHGDLDNDCDTDLGDFVILAFSWLDCMSDKLGTTLYCP